VDPRRLLVVHAHPDDETLSTGLTMALAVAAGVRVTLVTCTLGQRGEVIGPELQHLGDATDEAVQDELGRHRAGELAAAMRALGVRDHRLLAGGRWRDSGMLWRAHGLAGPAADVHPAAFALADLDVAAGELATVLGEVRPQAVLTYDPGGGYGHPDHVMAHRVTMRAVELARVGGRSVPAVYWTRVAVSWAQEDRRRARAAAADGSLPAPMIAPPPGAGYPAVVVPDDELDVVLRATPAALAKVRAALAAHRTQVRLAGPWFALSDDVAHLLPSTEGFHRAGRIVDNSP
jgi:N-acetyl-1-D-myo-inositol-2-amino-2-deoxy-alpha-D-glucopyranoside deacetylase